MMIKKIVYSLLLLVFGVSKTEACTNLIVGKGASADGSVLLSYSADSYSLFGELYHFPAVTYPKNALLDVFDWDTGLFLGKIAQARQTYNVIGNMNEFQVTIAETTFSGRPELVDSTGIMDYGSLIYIALQRSKTAKEAITVMTDLVEKYGYYSSGESFSIADPNEVWILEMIGKGVSIRGAVWVAVRIPDNCIAAHANQARIQTFDLSDKDNCLYSSDVITFAREKGYFKGVNKDFNFAQAYAPLDFGARRFCEARVWSFYNQFSSSMADQLPYIQGVDNRPMPLYIKIDRKISVQDLQKAMRDHYEGTPLDLTQDLGAGPYQSPYRNSPLTFKVDGKNYFNERPISTQQTAFVFVAQMRANKPNPIGGVLWFGMDDANMTVFSPIYCCTTDVPTCYQGGNGDLVTLSWSSSFWVFNWVANMVYPKYKLMIPDLRIVQQELETNFKLTQDAIESIATKLYATNKEEAKSFLSAYSNQMAESTHFRWKQLGEYLLVKYNDGVVKKEKNGKFERNATTNRPLSPTRIGYPQEFLQKIVESSGDRYLQPNP